MEDKISVIVPVYNAEKYLNKCIESIVNQTYKNLEIILVDDGSPDNCPKICDDWAKKDKRIKVVHKDNGGVSSARNAGLDICGGKYISFIDSDDYIDLDYYETLYKRIKKDKSEIAGCAIMRENPDGKSDPWIYNGPEYDLKTKNEVLIEISSTLDLISIHVGNKLINKDLTNGIRFDSSLKYCEDLLFNFQIALRISSFSLINIPKYHFTYNFSSATKNRDPDYKFDELKVADIISDKIPPDLSEYAARGNVLRTLNKIKEVVVDNTCDRQEYKSLRKRVVANYKEIIGSPLYTKATKLKTVFILLMPDVYKLANKIYGTHQVNKERKLYANK